MAYRGGGVFYCAGKKVESMDYASVLDDCGMGEVVLHKLNRIRKNECFNDGIRYMEAAVVVECWTNVEAFEAAEVPRFSCGGLVVDYNWTPHGFDGCCIKVEGPIVVLPGQHGRGNVILAKGDSRRALFEVGGGPTNSWGSRQRFRIEWRRNAP